jgi:hypothetical protein
MRLRRYAQALDAEGYNSDMLVRQAMAPRKRGGMVKARRQNKEKRMSAGRRFALMCNGCNETRRLSRVEGTKTCLLCGKEFYYGFEVMP